MVGITFMEQTRHIVKYSCGIEAEEIPRPVCLCSLSYEDDTSPIFTVKDTLLHERLRDHPFVCGGPCVRFYCGASIFIDGVKVGVICVLDTQPHLDFSEAQQQLLVEMAECAADLLNNKRVLQRDNGVMEDIILQHKVLSEVETPLKDVNSTMDHMKQLLFETCYNQLLCPPDEAECVNPGLVAIQEHYGEQFDALLKTLKSSVHNLESILDVSIRNLVENTYPSMR